MMPVELVTKLKKWTRAVAQKGKRKCTNRVGSSSQSSGLKGVINLPMELLIEIALIAASDSQASYRNFLLVSKEFSSIMERECWSSLSIKLETTTAIISFHKMITRRTDLADRVYHLWLKGGRSHRKPKLGYSEPSASTWREFKASAFEQLHIIHSCTNLVSLACSFPVMFLCFRFTKDVFFKHDHLKELTLFENWNLWTCFLLDPVTEGPHLFLQLTHLTILDNVAPHFPAQMFPSLRYFSAEMYPASPKSVLDAFKSKNLFEFPLPPNIRSLPENVAVTLTLLNNSSLESRKLTSESGRPWTMVVGRPPYFDLWLDRTRGGVSLV